MTRCAKTMGLASTRSSVDLRARMPTIDTRQNGGGAAGVGESFGAPGLVRSASYPGMAAFGGAKARSLPGVESGFSL